MSVSRKLLASSFGSRRRDLPSHISRRKLRRSRHAQIGRLGKPPPWSRLRRLPLVSNYTAHHAKETGHQKRQSRFAKDRGDRLQAQTSRLKGGSTTQRQRTLPLKAFPMAQSIQSGLHPWEVVAAAHNLARVGRSPGSRRRGQEGGRGIRICRWKVRNAAVGSWA
jgi:hypothetical protein